MERLKKIPLNQITKLERKAADLKVHFEQPYISLEDIDSETGKVHISQREKPKSTKYLFSDKHVLYGKLRPYLRKVARPAFKGICSTDIIPILPLPELNRDYLYHFLRTDSITAQATKLSVGVNLPRLSPKQLSTFEIPLPTFDSQKRIARILDAADALRAKRRESLTLLDNLTQSIFIDMFGDPVTNPMGWEIKKLGMLCTLKSGGTPSRRNEDFFKGSIPWITTKALGRRYVGYGDANELITEEAICQSATQVVPRGSLLVGVRVGVGKVSIAKCEISTNQDIMSLHGYDESLANDFLRFQLIAFSDILSAQTRGATIKGINSKTLKDLSIILPPLHLQQRFASIVESIEKQKERLKNQLSHMDTLFSSLQQRAFNGEL